MCLFAFETVQSFLRKKRQKTHVGSMNPKAGERQVRSGEPPYPSAYQVPTVSSREVPVRYLTPASGERPGDTEQPKKELGWGEESRRFWGDS